MDHVKRIVGMGLLALLLLAGCSRNPAGRPTPASATSLPSETFSAGEHVRLEGEWAVHGQYGAVQG